MIKTPHIFGQIEGYSLLANASLGDKSPLEISPKTLKPIYMIALFICIFAAAVFYHTVDIAPGRNTSITLPGVGADNRVASYPLINKWHEGLGLHVRHYLSPYLTAPAQDAKHRGLQSAATPFDTCFALFSAFVSPLATYICLINFNRPAEDLGDVFTHYCADYCKGPVYPLVIDPCFMANSPGAQPVQKPSKNIHPFIAGQVQWKTVWPPFISAPGASPLSPSYKINSFKRTSGTYFPGSHTPPTLSNLVAKL